MRERLYCSGIKIASCERGEVLKWNIIYSFKIQNNFGYKSVAFMSFLPEARETHNQQKRKVPVKRFSSMREDWQAHNRESTPGPEICVEEKLMRGAWNDWSSLPQFCTPLKPSSISFPPYIFTDQVSGQDFWELLFKRKGVYKKMTLESNAHCLTWCPSD